MKTAFIPPIPELEMFGHGNFHLLLSHLLDDDYYRKHYTEERKRGAYIILDNSAHEFKAAESAKKLIKQAAEIKAQEVVVPDVLEDSAGTVNASLRALETWFERKDDLVRTLNPALMYVPQGSTEAKWAWCLEELIRCHLYISKKYQYRDDFVIGLSKDYEVWPGGLMHLIDTYLVPLHENPTLRVKIHLLGWGRNLWELNSIGKKHPWIRSTDSAKPFVYALDGIKLDPGLGAPQYPTRGKFYFQTPMTARVRRYARHNCAVFSSCAQGELT